MSGRDYVRTQSFNLLTNVLNMVKDEEIELRDIVKEWQKNGGLLMFSQQIGLIQRNAASRVHVKFFIERLKFLNKEFYSKDPYRDYLIVCITAALDALQDAIGESSYLREQMRNKAINSALQSTSVMGGEQYFLNDYKDDDEDEYNEDEDDINQKYKTV